MFEGDFINTIFSQVSNKYDLMNDIMSFGIHRIWKQRFCSEVDNLNSKILDVASGSGDIAFGLYQKAKAIGADLKITISDINLDMLQLAKNRAINNNILTGLEFAQIDACNLPFSDNIFDYYTIAFGIRNIPDIKSALNQAHRVLKPKAKFLCMEFSKPTIPGFKNLISYYYNNIIPEIGAKIAGNYTAYKYLADSIYQFPDQNIFISMMQSSGFKVAYFKKLSFGLVSIYIGYKE